MTPPEPDIACPFCGGGETTLGMDHTIDGDEYVFVECQECQARGPWIGCHLLNDSQQAVKAWNTRHHEKENQDG